MSHLYMLSLFTIQIISLKINILFSQLNHGRYGLFLCCNCMSFRFVCQRNAVSGASKSNVNCVTPCLLPNFISVVPSTVPYHQLESGQASSHPKSDNSALMIDG